MELPTTNPSIDLFKEAALITMGTNYVGAKEPLYLLDAFSGRVTCLFRSTVPQDNRGAIISLVPNTNILLSITDLNLYSLTDLTTGVSSSYRVAEWIPDEFLHMVSLAMNPADGIIYATISPHFRTGPAMWGIYKLNQVDMELPKLMMDLNSESHLYFSSDGSTFFAVGTSEVMVIDPISWTVKNRYPIPYLMGRAFDRTKNVLYGVHWDFKGTQTLIVHDIVSGKALEGNGTVMCIDCSGDNDFSCTLSPSGDLLTCANGQLYHYHLPSKTMLNIGSGNGGYHPLYVPNPNILFRNGTCDKGNRK
jgi:hypothetical protein